MGTPAKKRKLNDKKSPAAGRSLDYFFGKQKQNVTTQPSAGPEDTAVQGGEGTELTDEQLARKLQAEWDQEGIQDSKVAANTDIANQQSSLITEGLSRSTSPEKSVQALEDGATSDSKLRPFSLQPKGHNTLSLQSAGSVEDTVSSTIPFDESPLTFDPSTYVGELQGYWAAEGGDASYAILTRCFVLVNSTQSRIKIVDTLVNLLRVIIEADPTSLLPTVGTTHILFWDGIQTACFCPHSS